MQLDHVVDQSEPRLLGSAEAANYLGVAPPTLLRLIARGVINPVQIPGVRRTLIDWRDLDALVEAAKIQQTAQSHGAAE
jgi:excisionase family DNA binding protein